jgi:hypothetical protein
MVPMRGNADGSTVMVRLVPIAFGLPGHDCARAADCAGAGDWA